MTTSIIEIKAAITAKQAEIAEVKSQIDNFEYVSSEADYDAMLDSEGEVHVGGLYFRPSVVIKNCDPTAYRCGKSDYDAAFDIEDCEEYQDLFATLKDLEDELYDLEKDLAEAE